MFQESISHHPTSSQVNVEVLRPLRIGLLGLGTVGAGDMVYAEQFGYRIKLLGIARRSEHGLELRVHPALLPTEHLLAQVEGSMNAVMVNGDASGVTLYYGAGAGAEETASAVIADLVDIACASACGPRHRVPALGFQSGALTALAVLPMAEVCSRYYLRVDTAPGTEAAQAVLQALRSAGIGLQSHRCLAHASNAQRQAVTVLTQPMADGALRQALVASHNGPIGHTRAIRVAPLD